MENSKAFKKKKTCCFNCSSLRGSSLTSQLGRVVLKYILFVFIFFHHVILLFFVKIWYFGHQRYQLFNANSIKYYNFATDWYIGKSHWYLWCHWDLPPPIPLGGNLRSLLKATAAPSILLLFSATKSNCWIQWTTAAPSSDDILSWRVAGPNYIQGNPIIPPG